VSPRKKAAAVSHLLIDISNSFTKVARVRGDTIGRVRRIPTGELTKEAIQAAAGNARQDRVVLSSVVPSRTPAVLGAFPEALVVDHTLDLGVGIDYPDPSGIGADRLANAAACAALHGCPGIVVDFGTAVTFDVVSAAGSYIGGVIAPGLKAMTDHLHESTALLPALTLARPKRVVGRTTREAMLSGAVHGYRGLVWRIVEEIRAEKFRNRKPVVVATGGDAEWIAEGVPMFDAIDPLLTLRGLLVIARRNPERFPSRGD
jgi:type III pantothenate kinase